MLGLAALVLVLIVINVAFGKPSVSASAGAPSQTESQTLMQSIQDKYRGEGKTITVTSCVQQSDTVYICVAAIPGGNESLNVTVDADGNWVAVPGN